MVVLYICLACALAMFQSSVAQEPNPPTWPSTVSIFGPEDAIADIQAKVNQAFSQNGGHVPDDHGQFSSQRFAFLFKPGRYNVEVPVGYYTQVLGLGQSPSDVIFDSAKGVYCEEGSFTIKPGALDNFWRGAENFQTEASFVWNDGQEGMLWAASQSSPLRRLMVTNNLALYQYIDGFGRSGFSSGGFIGNSQVKGSVFSGSQQQYLARNIEVRSWHDGVWNMVFVGTKGAPAGHCGANQRMCVSPYVTVDSTPVVAEKPFITVDTAGKYVLNIPKVGRNRVGLDLDAPEQIGFENVYVASSIDTATTINAKLALGRHVVLAPGIYELDAALELRTPGQVLLGLGLATLVSTSGNPVVTVGSVDGVRVAGVLLEAGSEPTDVLLQWGDPSHKGDPNNPGLFHDVFARVGGPASPKDAQAKVMLQIDSGNVIGDNLWMWRADHTVNGPVKNGANPCDVGIIINGDDVTMYGAKAEHTLQDQLQWNGERGASYFFQSELPYDVTQAYGDSGYAAYRVKSTVTTHTAYGTGAYHFFRDYAVVVKSGIVAPVDLEESFVSPLAVFLDGKGVMQHVINDKGNQTSKTHGTNAVPTWWCPTKSQAQFSFDRSKNATCAVGAPVKCPGTSAGCAGMQCCPDGSTCPSAPNMFLCCPKPKTVDCTNGTSPSPRPSPPSPPAPPPPPPTPPAPPPPAPGTRCKVGQTVKCPGTSIFCAGDQCCGDGSTCPSADGKFTGCPMPKKFDCTKVDSWLMHKSQNREYPEIIV